MVDEGRPATASENSMNAVATDLSESKAREWTSAPIYSLGLLTLIYSLNYLDRQIISLVLPLLKADLHLTDTELGLVIGFAFVLFYSLMGVPIARLADRSNRRNIIAVGCAFWSVMTCLSGFVANVWQLAATRFLMGAGEAAGVAPSNSMIADLVSRERRPLALSIMTSGTGLAALVFFPIVGWIASTHGWRSAFVFAGIAGTIVSALFFATVREPPRQARAISASPTPFLEAVRFLAGARSYLLVIAGGAFMGIALYANLIWSATFLARVHGFSIVQIGTSLGPIRGICGIAGVLAGGLLASKLGERSLRWQLLVPGIACVLVLPAELLFLLPSSDVASLTGLGVAHFFASMHLGPIYSACLSIAGPRLRATASALFLLVANLVGQIIGPLVVGRLNDVWRAQYGSLAIRYSMVVGACCALIAGLLIISGAGYFAHDARRADYPEFPEEA
jgi:predicted MFS family arabinose efflux permease